VTVQPPEAEGTNGTDGNVTTGSAANAGAGNASTPRAKNKIREEDIAFPVGGGREYSCGRARICHIAKVSHLHGIRSNMTIRGQTSSENSRSTAATNLVVVAEIAFAVRVFDARRSVSAPTHSHFRQR